MAENNIVIEKAKDNNLTCKINIEGKWKYLYSKYSPIKKINNITESSNYIVLGIGLSYELQQISENTTGIIYVVDKDKTFYNISAELNLLDKILNNPRVKFLFGDEYTQIKLDETNNFKIYNNENLTQIDITYFLKVVKFFNRRRSNKIRIAFCEHVTIADDCMEVLISLGYDVVKILFSSKAKMTQDIMDAEPDYIFSINLSEKVTDISKRLSIPYISWTVDTPAYSLYDDLLENENVISFIYDYNIVYDLRSKGLKNVFYMPVAANVNRLDEVNLSPRDILKYSCDASFLGSTDINNDFDEYINNFLSRETLQKIEKVFNKQLLCGDNYIIGDFIDNDLINKIEQESRYNIVPQAYIDRKQKLAFLLGRKFNELQRINIIKDLSTLFNFHVYGDKNWDKLSDYHIKYKGYAEHFNEMPKVFKCSKVNINYTRIYVDSGLPMRVFDVLGSKGFLATNYKDDISKYFVDGRDLVVYRDTKDLIDIINYYLNHEKKRQEIILNGYESVKNNHTYEIRLKEILNITRKHFKEIYKNLA